MLPLEEHQSWSLDHSYMWAVTARRSDGPHPCRNNPGWRSVLLSDAAVTMPRHAVIAASLPVGLNTGSLTQGIRVRSCEARLRRCRTHPAAQGAQVPASAHPGQGGTAWHAPVPSCVPPRSHRGGTSFLSAAAPICRPFRTSSSRLPPPAASRVRFSFHQPIGGIHHRYPPDCPSQSPCLISPQGVRQAPHSRQQVTLCTWPLPFGDLASASWQ